MGLMDNKLVLSEYVSWRIEGSQNFKKYRKAKNGGVGYESIRNKHLSVSDDFNRAAGSHTWEKVYF